MEGSGLNTVRLTPVRAEPVEALWHSKTLRQAQGEREVGLSERYWFRSRLLPTMRRGAD